MSKIVDKYREVALGPDVAALVKLDPAVAGLLPKSQALRPAACSMELGDVPLSIANGLRRAVSGEVAVKALNMKLEALTTTDDFIINDLVQLMIRQLPVVQSLPADATYHLKVVNPSAVVIRVTSGDLRPGSVGADSTGAKVPPIEEVTAETFTLAELLPGKTLAISNIFVETGFSNKHGVFKAATNAAILPLDQKPFDPYRPAADQTTSGMADSRRHLFKFVTRGTIGGRELVALACDTIAGRLIAASKSMATYFEDALSKEGTSANTTANAVSAKSTDARLGFLMTPIIADENDTVGAILQQMTLEMFNDSIDIINYTVGPIDKTLRIEIRMSGPGIKGRRGQLELEAAAMAAVALYQKIKEEILKK
jgi:hypothetical protein